MNEFEHEEKKKNTFMNLHRNEKEDASADMPDYEEHSASRKVTKDLFVEEAATCEQEDSSDLRNFTTSKDLEEKINKISEQPLSHDSGIVYKTHYSDSDGALGLNPDPLKRETSSPVEEENKKTTATAPEKEDVQYIESLQVLQELDEEQVKASQLNRQLQMKLVEYFSKRRNDYLQLERERPGSEQLQEYKKYIHILSDLKQQLNAESESAQREEAELRMQAQEKLDRAEKEWKELVSLKQDAAVTALSCCLGKEAALDKVQSVLTAEHLQQDELTKARIKHFKLRFEICRLEAELQEGDKHSRDPLQMQFEKLKSEWLEQKKQAEKRSEESLKLQKKISSSLEVLSNVKEKLYWSQMEVQTKRQQLAEVETLGVRKKELLIQTKQARNHLQRDNTKLKESHGLLGNRVLLRDFEDTVEESDHLEKHLEKLKSRRVQIVFRCGRQRRKPGSALMDEQQND